MKKRIFCFPVLFVVFSMLLSVTVFANSAEPPNITVLIPNAPDEIDVSLIIPESGGQEFLTENSRRIDRGWESYFRFWVLDFDRIDLSGAKIRITSDTYDISLDLPSDDMNVYNNIVTVDLENESVSEGTYPGRYLLIAGIRVLSTLLMEGAVFLLFGYFTKRSWLIFIAVNLATQAFLNIALYGTGIDSYVLLAYIFVEAVIFAAETCLFPALLRENSKRKAVLYALTANAVSLIGGGLMISHMPL